MSEERCEELLINVIEWAIECFEPMTQNLLRATGITSSELDSIGYDESEFPEMHQMIQCRKRW